MRQNPAAVFTTNRPEVSAKRWRGRRLSGPLARAAGVLAWVAACALAPRAGHAQMFIRVAPPSAAQQDQPAVTAMPGTPAQPGNAVGGSRPEAVLSDDGQVVKMVDANGKEVTKSSSSWKDWRPTFYANLRLAYDDNIFIQRNKNGDFVTTFEPGIVLGWGDYRSALPRLGEFQHEYEIPADDLTSNRYLYIDYHPTVEIFAKNSDQDTVDEDVLANGSYQFAKLTVLARAQYQTLSDTDIDAGDRVDRTIYLGALSGLYNYSDKTTLEANLSVDSAQYSGVYESSTEFVDRNFLNYQYAPKTNVSGGFAIGYLIPESSSNQLYEQLLARVRWSGSDKLFMNGTVGIEVRESTSGTTKVNGIYDVAVNYVPFDGTRLSLTSSRSTQPSEAELGEDIVLTDIAVQAQQRFLGRLYVNGGVEYRNADYENVSTGTNVSRTDNSVNLLLGVGMDLTQYAGIQLAGRFLKNDSTLFARSFDDHQVTLQLDVLY